MRATLASLLAVVLTPGLAVAAQDQTTGSLSTIPLGTTVQVIITNGQQLTGPVVGASADGLVLDMPQARRMVPVGEIVRVEKHDSVTNGGILGAVFGAAAMGPAVYLCGEDQVSIDTTCAVQRLLVGVGIGAVVGVAVDSAIGREVLYSASASGARELRLAPLVSASAVGVSGVITWR